MRECYLRNAGGVASEHRHTSKRTLTTFYNFLQHSPLSLMTNIMRDGKTKAQVSRYMYTSCSFCTGRPRKSLEAISVAMIKLVRKLPGADIGKEIEINWVA